MRISDWSSDVCSSDLGCPQVIRIEPERQMALSVEAVGGDRYCGLWISAASCGNRCRCLSAVAQHSKTLLLGRSEERRVGKECDSTCRSRWSRDHPKNKHEKQESKGQIS